MCMCMQQTPPQYNTYTHINFHFPVQSIVQQQIVCHSHTMRLHWMPLSIVEIANVTCNLNHNHNHPSFGGGGGWPDRPPDHRPLTREEIEIREYQKAKIKHTIIIIDNFLFAVATNGHFCLLLFNLLIKSNVGFVLIENLKFEIQFQSKFKFVFKISFSLRFEIRILLSNPLNLNPS